MVELGRFEDVEITKVWAMENHFTHWLSENIDYIEDIVGFEIGNLEEQKQLGGYFADLVGINVSSDENEAIVIENQYGSTDHDHLGKLLSYMAGAKAKYGVWIAESFREEHISAVKYINDISKNNNEDGISLFGLEIGLKRIENSKPAVELDVIIKPDIWQRGFKKTEKEKSRYEFWSKLIDEYNRINPKFKKISPSQDPWIIIPSGRSGMSYAWSFKQSPWRFQIEFNIDIGDKNKNIKILNILRNYKEAIEKEMGFNVNFEEKEDTRYQRISYSDDISLTNKPFTELDDVEKDNLVKWGADHMSIFYKTLNRYIQEKITKDI